MNRRTNHKERYRKSDYLQRDTQSTIALISGETFPNFNLHKDCNIHNIQCEISQQKIGSQTLSIGRIALDLIQSTKKSEEKNQTSKSKI